jgi:hypothetical protein
MDYVNGHQVGFVSYYASWTQTGHEAIQADGGRTYRMDVSGTFKLAAATFGSVIILAVAPLDTPKKRLNRAERKSSVLIVIIVNSTIREASFLTEDNLFVCQLTHL